MNFKNIINIIEIILLCVAVIGLISPGFSDYIHECKSKGRYDKYREHSIYMSNILINYKILEITFEEFYETFSCSKMVFLSEYDRYKYKTIDNDNLSIWLELSEGEVRAEVMKCVNKDIPLKYETNYYIILFNDVEEYEEYLNFYKDSKDLKHKIQNRADIKDVLAKPKNTIKENRKFMTNPVTYKEYGTVRIRRSGHTFTDSNNLRKDI